MTLQQILAVVVGLTVLIGTPVAIIWTIIDHIRNPRAKNRGSGSMTAGIGAAMQELDRLMARPSAEHTIEAERPILKREDDGGDPPEP
jgi:hypothetical protein